MRNFLSIKNQSQNKCFQQGFDFIDLSGFKNKNKNKLLDLFQRTVERSWKIKQCMQIQGKLSNALHAL